jgi:hypothetical protein
MGGSGVAAVVVSAGVRLSSSSIGVVSVGVSCYYLVLRTSCTNSSVENGHHHHHHHQIIP